MRILYVGRRDKNHSKYGGYDYITTNPGTDYFDCEKTIFGRIPSGIPGRGILMYSLGFIFSIMNKNKYDVIHFFYGDFMLFTKVPSKCKAKFFITVHLITDNYSKRKIAILKSFTSVIVLSKSQEISLKNKGINSKFIPHGFNTPMYTENQIMHNQLQMNKVNIFFSGTNYRDFELLISIIEFCQVNRKDIVFHIVGQNSHKKAKLSGYSNTKIYNRLNDNDYYTLLNSCDYNFLPLLFATANNALLEAQAFGLTSILPSIMGINDYSDSMNNYFYSDIESAKSIFIKIQKSDKTNKLIDYSKTFLWSNITNQLNSLYSKYLN